MALLSRLVSFLGMYPQTVVPLTNSIHDVLTAGEDEYGNQVTQLKDVYYTANVDGIGWNPSDEHGEGAVEELNEVYSYLGDRYVKVTPWANGTGVQYKYSSKEQIERVSGNSPSHRWFKVEPIKWIVLNHDWLPKDTIDGYSGTYSYGADFSKAHTNIELYAADILMSGIQFNSTTVDENIRNIWSESMINTYLNDVLHNEAFSLAESELIQPSTIYNNRTSTITYSNSDPAYNLNYNYSVVGGGKNSTGQYIYLLSQYEMSDSESPYVKNGIFYEGTGDTSTRQVGGTDYARAHSLILYTTNNYSIYWGRTAGSGIDVCRVHYEGRINSVSATAADKGTRPALQLNEWLC